MAQPLWLTIEGARQNNLKNLSVRIPHDRMTVITGVSGSGKSSLAFDTLFAEGQWRYIESLSTSTRFRSRTATVALPTVGLLYSTGQVAKSATRAWGAKRAGGRLANHLENVSRWNLGRFRSLWIPTMACRKARWTVRWVS